MEGKRRIRKKGEQFRTGTKGGKVQKSERERAEEGGGAGVEQGKTSRKRTAE